MPHDLPKAYDPTAIEDHWAEYWVREKLFTQPTPPPEEEGQGGKPFTILLPPPNVTGRLHMGHMLNQTEMDILTRRDRNADDGGAATRCGRHVAAETGTRGLCEARVGVALPLRQGHTRPDEAP